MHIGPALSEARTEAGMTVADVSERTRIRRAIISDIERDDYSSCGGDFYARGHIRAIAKVVGTDPVPLIEEYDESTAARDDAAGTGIAGNRITGNGATGDGAAREGAAWPTGPDPKTWLQAEGRTDPLLWAPPAGGRQPDGPADAVAGTDFASPAADPGPTADAVTAVGPDLTWVPDGPADSDVTRPAGPSLADSLRGAAAGASQAGAAALQRAAARMRQARTQLTAGHPASSGPPGAVQAGSGRPAAGPVGFGQLRGTAADLRRASAEAVQRLSRLRTADLGPSRIVGGIAIFLAALVLILYVIFSGPARGSARPSAPPRHHPAPASHPAAAHKPAPRKSAAASRTSSPAVAALRPAGVAAFGPGGPADGDNRQSAGQALSPRRGGWHTNWYTTASFGGLQSGTGLLIELGRTATVSRLAVRLGPAAGAAVQLRAGAAPALAALRPVAAARSQGGTLVLAPSTPVRARYLLIWFTRLPRDSAGTYQAAITGITVTGSGTPS